MYKESSLHLKTKENAMEQVITAEWSSFDFI